MIHLNGEPVVTLPVKVLLLCKDQITVDEGFENAANGHHRPKREMLFLPGFVGVITPATFLFTSAEMNLL